MSTVFDRWSELDTALLLRRIEAAHGSVVFDRYAYADPQHALRQIESVFGVALNTAGALSFSAIAAAIDAAVAGGGGGDTPNWVPANAKIHIDLVNNRAWTETDGEVAIDTLLGADPNTENGWGPTSYNAGLLTANGYPGDGSLSPGTDVAYIGAALTKILTGATVVTKTKIVDVLNYGTSPFIVLSADGNHAVEFDFDDQLKLQSWDGPARASQAIPCNRFVAGAINVTAVTYTATRAEAAANSGAAISSALTDAEVTGFVAAMCNHHAQYLQTLTIYDPLPSTAGLSALSETGVTNTAPRDLNAKYSNNGPTGIRVYVGDTSHTNYLFANGGDLNATDDQGNPLTVELIDDDGGNFAFYDTNDGITVITGPIPIDGPPHVALSNVTQPLSLGDYNVTLRATDPYGLFVDQVFTITVQPDWVPDGSKIHIDLVNNRAWTLTDGIVAIDTLLGSDPNTVNAWSASNYDPAQLTAYGYVAPENIVLALIGGARERVLSGSTLVLRNIIPTSDLIVGLSFVIASATGNNSIEIDLSNNNNIRDVFAYSGGGLANLTFAPIVNVGVNGAINTLAATVTSARLELSVNGSTALSTALTTDDFPVSGDVLVAALISQPNAANALQSITIYDALPDTTGLSALSATGVTNTAPRNFTFNEALASPDRQTGPFDFTLPATDFVSFSYFKINQINATDDEGNPLTLTMPDTGGGVFALTDTNTDIGVPIESALAGSTNINAAMVAYNAGIAPAPGVYNFTLRATDPGGLYVEQVFTITVTA